MQLVKIIKLYFNALEIGDYDQMIKLFTEDAVVCSPLYGQVNASKFYKDLFVDTSKSEITLLHIFEKVEDLVAAVHFRYDWELAGGAGVSFEGVDIMEFSEKGLITKITIIYDTASTKEAFYRMKDGTQGLC